MMPEGTFAWVKGIYVTQPSLENSRTIRHLIRESKAVGINTFVIDASYHGRRFSNNIRFVHQAGIRYVARVVIFPHGGSRAQVMSPAYWQRKQRLIEFALANGAQAIQLDYIRYNTKQPSRRSNVDDIHDIIRWFKQQLRGRATLQVDVFGETSFMPSYRIGQDVRVFAPTIDALCPMVYPSHYRPYAYHSYHPYETIYKSLTSLKRQFSGKPPFQVIPFIEVRNFRYRWGGAKARDYLYQQIKAVEDAGAQGWYAWSPNNHYSLLFSVLRSYKVK